METFGQRLQEVFLLAPQEELITAMEKFYGDLVDPTLFAVWMKDPLGAPGYLKSTSIPERIDEIQAKRQSDGSYEIQGILIETDQGQEVNRLDIRLVVSPLEQGWRITQVSLNPDEALPPVGYSNTHYGFSLSLPES